MTRSPSLCPSTSHVWRRHESERDRRLSPVSFCDCWGKQFAQVAMGESGMTSRTSTRTAYSSEEKDVGVRAGFQKALSPVSGNREAGGVECALFWIGTPECA